VLLARPLPGQGEVKAKPSPRFFLLGKPAQAVEAACGITDQKLMTRMLAREQPGAQRTDRPGGTDHGSPGILNRSAELAHPGTSRQERHPRRK
jgi:hypothetical protein